MSHPVAAVLKLCGTTAQAFAPAETNTIPLPAAPKASKYLPYNPQGIPQAIRDHPHWLVANPTGRPVGTAKSGNSKTNPAHWIDFETASRLATERLESWPYMVLTDSTRITIFDVDGKPRKAHESAADLIERLRKRDDSLARLREWFPVRYEERSKSGNGFHIVVSGTFQGTGGNGKGNWSEVEIYTRAHGVALTGKIVTGSTVPGRYPPETLQLIRDEIKGEDGTVEPIEHNSDGTVPPEWARKVLEEVAEKLGNRPDYPDWLKVSSAVFDGAGVEAGIGLLEEVWPEEKRGEYKRLARSLRAFIPWGTLRAYGVNPNDPEELLVGLPVEDGSEDPMPASPEIEPFAIFRAGLSAGMAVAADFVEGLLTEGGASVIYGPSNCGKSFWVLDLAVAVATGKPFRGNREVDQGAVIYVALEGSHGVRNRIEALRREGKLPDDAPLFLCFAPVSLLDKKHAAKLAASVKVAAEQSGQPCRLVILDTLARAMAGGDENSGKEMGAAVKSMDAIRAATGAHVLLVHHCGKNEALGARGHSSLRGAVDTEIEISRPDGETISTVRVTKQRDLPMGDAMPFSLVSVVLGTDRRGKPVSSCLVRHEGEEMASKPRRPGRKAKCTPEEMLRFLPAANVKEWKVRVADECGLGDSQFYDNKKRLEAAGKTRREEGSNRILPVLSADLLALEDEPEE